MDSKALGARIQLYRVRGKMTQKELGEKLGCTSQHISAIERGVKTPTLETFVTLCNVLQVQPNLLLRDVVDDAVFFTVLPSENAMPWSRRWWGSIRLPEITIQ